MSTTTAGFLAVDGLIKLIQETIKLARITNSCANARAIMRACEEVAELSLDELSRLMKIYTDDIALDERQRVKLFAEINRLDALSTKVCNETELLIQRQLKGNP